MTQPGTTAPFPFAADVSFQAGDLVFATDRFGCVVYWNKETEDLSGFKAQEVLGRPYAMACRIEATGPAAIDLSSILGGRDFAGARRCHTRSGNEVALYLFATAGRNQAGEVAGVVFVGRDVTGLWNAEEAVQASADKYRVLFENTLDAVAVADMAGQVLEANPACLRSYGYTIQEARKINLLGLVAPEDRPAAARLMKSLASGQQVAKTLRMRRKDGAGFVVDLLASTMQVGGERRMLLVTRDVTERVRAEQATSQSERMYRAVFESANDAVFIESVDGRILDVNRHGCELLGYRRGELLKMSVSDLVPADARAWLPHVTDAILRERTFRTEAVNVHKSGRQIPVEMSASTMELDGKTVVLAIVRDITKRKLAEQALRESEENFRALAENATEGVIIGDENGRHLFANRRAAEILGYPAEELLKMTFRDVSPPGDRDLLEDRYARRSRGEDVPSHYAITLLRRDGRTVPADIGVSLTRWQGRPAAMVMLHDTSERARLARAAEETADELRAVLDNSPGAIVGECDGVLVYANQKYARLLGYDSPAEVIGRPAADFDAPEDRELLAGYTRLREQGRDAPASYTYHGLRRDGTVVPLQATISTYRSLGRLHVLAFIREAPPNH